MRGARVVWVNWPYLRELGVPSPSSSARAAFEDALLDAFAWRAVEADDDPSTFVGAPSTWYADRYGGEGPTPNLGSGRAASRGRVQIKGIGATRLVHPSANAAHRNGALPLGEALREALWGELSQAEAPHGANRVLVVIDCGRDLVTAEGARVRRGLAIRPFPLRPAHFLLNASDSTSAAAVRAALPRLASALPARGAPAGARVRRGLLALVRRAAEQAATLLARRIPHGSLNSSNLELDGRLLDFGSQSAQPGHGPTRGFPRWSNRVGLSLPDSLHELSTSLQRAGPRAWRARLPNRAQVHRAYHLAQGETLLRELLHLSALPDLATSRTRSDAAWELAFALHALAFLPCATVELCHRAPRWTGVFDVGRVLYALACLPRASEATVLRRLGGARPHAALVAVVRAYFALRAEVRRQAALDDEAFDELLLRLTALRNHDRPALMQTTLRRAYELRVARYRRTGDVARLAAHVDSDVVAGRRFFPARRGRHLLRRWDDRASGASVEYLHGPDGYVLALHPQREDHALRLFGQHSPAARAEVELRWVGVAGRVTLQRKPLSRAALRIPRDARSVGLRLVGANERARGPALQLELLPSLYLSGVDRIERDRKLAQKVRPQLLPEQQRGVPKPADYSKAPQASR